MVGLVVVLWGEPSAQALSKLSGRRVLTYDQVLEQGGRRCLPCLPG